MDKIIIEDLEVYAYHGVAAEEKALGQLFTISLEISADLAAASESGDLAKTINYAEVCDTVLEVLRSDKYDLIETAALMVIKAVFSGYARAEAVKIRLKKPWAPMGHHLEYVAVELERTRSMCNG